MFKRIVLIFVLSLAGDVAVADSDGQQAALRAAFAAADRGTLSPDVAAAFSRDPLYPWLQATMLRSQITSAVPAQVQPLLERYDGQPAAEWLRSAWLAELARRQDWANFRRAYRSSEDKTLRCADLAARLDAGATDEQWVQDARDLWLTGTSLADDCDPPFARMMAMGKLDQSWIWQRIDLAVAEKQTGVIRYLAKYLTPDDARLAQSYAAYIEAPTAAIPSPWPRTARSRAVATVALSRLAKRDPDVAEGLLPTIAFALKLDAEQRGQVLHDIALWTVASYLPGSAQRLNAVPEAAYDDSLREWRVREAITRGDDAAAIAGIEKMSETQRNDSHWQYFEARLRERAGQRDAAQALYRKAALSPGFHGWLAADRLRQTYALCALEPSADAGLRQRVANHAGLQRALALMAIDRAGPAAREWTAAVKPMTDDERRVAVQLALKRGWYDRAVFGMNSSPDDVRYYSLRFPLHHDAQIRAQSQVNGLDPAWVAGETRAESAFMPNARSSADARGLMQLLPGTGALTARRLGMAWQGGESLFEPNTNITLGTAYLRQMVDRFNGLPYLAIAAYNAGPAPVDRWMAQRSGLDPDFFIESIPYKETREYVARVLSFSVVYDWRLNGNAAPLSDRMLGHLVNDSHQRRGFACPLPNASRSTP
jgi:soluble lytic murein transglycosylase